MLVILEVISGPFLDRTIDRNLLRSWLRPGQSVTIGRSQVDADVAIPFDAQLSTVHFELSCTQDSCRLRDLDSTNGTFLNQTRVREAELGGGETIIAGQVVFSVQIVEKTEPDQETEPNVVLAKTAEQPLKPEPKPGDPIEPGGLPMMKLVSTVPLQFAPIQGRIGFPDHSATIVVKGTFALENGGVAKPVEEQPFPTGDEFYEDDEEGSGGPCYEMDFAYFKPKADLLLVGKCHPPGNKATEQCRVTFRVGEHSKDLVVFGNRRWDHSSIEPKLIQPEPFLEMPLRYENSFGGPAHDANPIGKGIPEDGQDHLLPNIEHPNQLIEGPSARPDPAGFGPLNRLWKLRGEKLGHFGDRWLNDRWPWFPEEFDWTHFNCASPDMQVDGYLRGDEEIYCKHLHPEHVEYSCRLPGQRVRCFLNEWDEVSGERVLRELPMHLDTLWVDMESERLVLVWRGVSKIPADDLSHIRHVFVTADPVDGPASSPQECSTRFSERLAALNARFEPPPEPPPPDPSPKQEQIPSSQEEDIDAEITEMAEQAGIELDSIPELTKEQEEEALQFLKELEASRDKEENDEDDQPDWTPDNVQECVARGESLHGENLSELNFSGFNLKGADFSDANLSLAKFHGADLSGANLSSANLTGCDLSKAHMTGADLRSADARAALCQEVDLSEADLSDAILTKSSLASANLIHANLTKAQLSGADLSNATLRAACLEQADLTRAILKDADLFAAKLSDAILSSADLSNATLEAATASHADFVGADLSGGSLHKCTLDQANLSRANLENTDLQKASLRSATIQDAHATDVNMTGADLTELRAAGDNNFTRGVFRETVGIESIWEGATLDEADFCAADMSRADFSSASMINANLSRSIMKSTQFARTDLTSANLRAANFMESGFEKANLTKADLRESNLYGCEFLDCTLQETRLEATNRKMTKLSELVV